MCHDVVRFYEQVLSQFHGGVAAVVVICDIDSLLAAACLPTNVVSANAVHWLAGDSRSIATRRACIPVRCRPT